MVNEEIQQDITPELIEQIKNSVEGTENRNIQLWVKDVNLDVMYDVAYRLFYQDVPTHPRLIENYLIMREDDEVGQIGWGTGVVKNIPTELLEAAKILLLAMDAIDHLFELQIKEEIKHFWKELQEIVGQEDT